ncbi:helix-turn-helix domain-containing protein [Embleya sp. NBC_00896]|uniref:helix-turn-helix domain-containing protein n=1 Tax=Embleya sp. NBC_00896 TaxID=2975961 RepID=UPI002F911954|nr:helix-turn-helix domain-containing protein [Embleya sp. NBC_00896]
MTSVVSPAALPRHVLDRDDMRQALADHDFGAVFRIARKYGGISFQKIADACDIKPERVGTLARGIGRITTVEKIRHIAEALRVPGEMIGMTPCEWEKATSGRSSVAPAVVRVDQSPEVFPFNDELDALELGRRAVASDVGTETLARLEAVFDELAIGYSVTPPHELLVRTRQHLSYVARLFDARKTLAEHRRLIALGGWLSLLSATLHIDLAQQEAATARLATAIGLAEQAEYPELQAWCHETAAWRLLTQGRYAQAADLSRAARKLAPKGSSVAIQATAQEGRVNARLGKFPETYDSIARVHKLVSNLPRPDRPEHHYRYDPNKSMSYTATTLAWLGDPAAEDYAREVIARLAPGEGHSKWPRRAAVAGLDLALTLLVNDSLDEACHSAQQAILSGRVVPSNHWRALEVVRAVEARGLPEAGDLRAAYQDLTRPGTPAGPTSACAWIHPGFPPPPTLAARRRREPPWCALGPCHQWE